MEKKARAWRKIHGVWRASSSRELRLLVRIGLKRKTIKRKLGIFTISFTAYY